MTRALNQVETIISDPTTSDWLRSALSSALDRDPVDALNDAELLASTLKERLETVFSALTE